MFQCLCWKNKIWTSLLIGKSKKPEKMKRKRHLVANDLSSDNLLEKRGEDVEDEVYQMSSGDEDYSKGMKSMILVSGTPYFPHHTCDIKHLLAA